MSSKELQKVSSINEKISNVILFFLLSVRLMGENLPTWIFGSSIPNWVPYWYAGIAYILTIVIVWLNRHRLAMLNIDRPFVITLMLGGLLYIFYLTMDIAILVGVVAGFVYWAYRNNHLILVNTASYPSRTGLLIVFSVLLALLPVFLYTPAPKTALSVQSIITAVFQAQLGIIVFEELIFRGALWAYLRDLGLKEPIAFFLQVFLFWISHHKYLLLHNPYLFWLAGPLAALLFGFIAWRSRSLTPSTIAHFLFNFTSLLIKTIF